MMGCKMPWWAGSETPPPDKDKMIADLRAEVDSLKEQNAQLERDVNDQSLELGELRPDAARYRYLRNRDIENDFPRDGLFIGCIPENVALSMEDADYAIDDAMVADSPQPSLTERQTDEQNRV